MIPYLRTTLRVTVAALGLWLASIPLASHSAPTQPDDPLFPQQWNLFTADAAEGTLTPDIQALRAWDITTGIPEVVIAVLDTGVDREHPDLATKVWTNADEIPGNLIDDDDNGFVDDVNGWDFLDDDNQPDDLDGHGTFNASVAAAASNNGAYIAGIAWRTPVMPLRVGYTDDLGLFHARVDDVVAAIQYAAANGARIIQFGFAWMEAELSEAEWEELRQAVEQAHRDGVLLVAPVGDYAVQGSPDPYPASFPQVLGVTATDRFGERLEFASYGGFVDLAAPGSEVPGLFTQPPHWTTAVGTAFAVPHVTGTAALVWAVNPNLTPDQVKEILFQTAEDLGALGRDQFYGFGLLNAALALQETPHLLRITPLNLYFRVSETGVIQPPVQTIVNPNTSGRTWRATTQTPWLVIEGLTETTPSSVSVSIDRRAVLNCGTYQGQIIVESSQARAQNSPQVVQVVLEFARPKCEKLFLPLAVR